MELMQLMKKASRWGAFFVALVAAAPAGAFCPAPAKAEPVQVESVVDGDTLRLRDGRSVRLIGINTPERGRKGRPAEPYAEAARRSLQQRVEASGGRIGLVLGTDSRDHYGRVLAHGYDRRGQNLEAALLSEGLGYFVAMAPNTALVDCHRAAERAARQAARGLWQRSPVRRPSEIRSGGFALVEGRVTSVERNRGGTWLELDGPLVVLVPPQARGFDLRALEGLAGRTVQVRGWVVERKARPGRARWMLRVTAPAMLEPSR